MRRGVEGAEKLPAASEAARAAAREQYTKRRSAESKLMKAKKIRHVTPTMVQIHQGGTHAVVVVTVVVVIKVDVLAATESNRRVALNGLFSNGWRSSNYDYEPAYCSTWRWQRSRGPL